jgi:hypothetical protein
LFLHGQERAPQTCLDIDASYALKSVDEGICHCYRVAVVSPPQDCSCLACHTCYISIIAEDTDRLRMTLIEKNASTFL